MKSVEAIRALYDHGLEGDAHARPGGARQVLFMDIETLNVLGLPPGALKENITTERLSLDSLNTGDLMHCGEATFLITMQCTPCAHLEEVRPGLSKEVFGRRGMLARVVKSGELQIGQALVIEPAPVEPLVHPTG